MSTISQGFLHFRSDSCVMVHQNCVRHHQPLLPWLTPPTLLTEAWNIHSPAATWLFPHCCRSRRQYSLSAQRRHTVTLHRLVFFSRRWRSSMLSSSLFPEICPTSHRDEIEYKAAGGRAVVLGDGQIMGTARSTRVKRELEVSWGNWERRDSIMEVGHHSCSRLLHMWLSRWWSTRPCRVPTLQLKQKQGQRSSQQASEKWDAEPYNITRTFSRGSSLSCGQLVNNML